MSALPAVLTTATVATLLGITPTRVRQITRTGRLPSRLSGSGRRVRVYRRDDVEAFLRSRGPRPPHAHVPQAHAEGRPDLRIERSEMDLARQVLVTCEHCGVSGPRARYEDHVRLDHHGAPVPEPVTVTLPGRFRSPLAAWEARTGRSAADVITAALDEWLRGRVRARASAAGWGPKDGGSAEEDA